MDVSSFDLHRDRSQSSVQHWADESFNGGFWAVAGRRSLARRAIRVIVNHTHNTQGPFERTSFSQHLTQPRVLTRIQKDTHKVTNGHIQKCREKSEEFSRDGKRRGALSARRTRTQTLIQKPKVRSNRRRTEPKRGAFWKSEMGSYVWLLLVESRLEITGPTWKKTKKKKQKIKQRPKCIVLCSGALHPKMGVHPNILVGFFYSLLFNPLLFFIFINCELVVVVYVA